MAMRVREVLALSPMKGSRILAGRGGLDREITGVNIIEVPDVRRWLRGGEFLFSAGYALRDDPNSLGDLVDQLYEVGVSAIGLKPGPYLPTVPRRVVELANRRNFPVIRIPPHVAYMDVIDLIFRQLAAQRLSVLERTFDMAELLASLGLDDQSLEAPAGVLAKELRNPVHVFDFFSGSVLSASEDGGTKRRSPESLHEELQRAGSGPLPNLAGRRPAMIDLPSTRALVESLVVGRREQGRVVVLEERATLDDFAERAVGQAAALLSFLLMKRAAVIEGRREAARFFLDSLMSDALSREEAGERAVTLGLRLSAPHVVLVIGLRQHDRDNFAVLRDLADRTFGAYPHATGETGDGRQVLVVIETDDSDPGLLEETLGRLQELMVANRGVLLLAGCGSAGPGLEGVRRSRSEAMIAYKTAQRMQSGRLLRFPDLGVERLLAQIPRNEVTDEYVTRVLGPLLDDDELLGTLEAYLEHRGNKVAAAAAMPLHRSSLMYRLEKISKKLDVDLDDRERFLELWLAVRLRRILC